MHLTLVQELGPQQVLTRLGGVINQEMTLLQVILIMMLLVMYNLMYLVDILLSILVNFVGILAAISMFMPYEVMVGLYLEEDI
jgi:hypothetical protein